jgi:hypothetical protein
MLAVEVLNPVGCIINRAIRFRDVVVREIRELAERRPDEILPLTFKLDKLAMGDLDDRTFGFAIGDHFESLLSQGSALVTQRM